MTTVFDFLFFGILGSATITHITIFSRLLTTSYPLPSNTLFIQKMTTIPHLMTAIREVRALGLLLWRFVFALLDWSFWGICMVMVRMPERSLMATV